jgi:hypothetical protein
VTAAMGGTANSPWEGHRAVADAQEAGRGKGKSTGARPWLNRETCGPRGAGTGRQQSAEGEQGAPAEDHACRGLTTDNTGAGAS